MYKRSKNATIKHQNIKKESKSKKNQGNFFFLNVKQKFKYNKDKTIRQLIFTDLGNVCIFPLDNYHKMFSGKGSQPTGNPPAENYHIK